jgi:Flp pilus assembly protein TadG
VSAVQLREIQKGETGAAAVEFAIVLPVLVMLLFGIVQMSMAFNRSQGLHAAAREGARLAALRQTTRSQIEGRVRDALDGVVKDPAAVAISITPSSNQPCNLRPGESVVVTASHPTELDIPLWGKQTLTLTGRGTFRCE